MAFNPNASRCDPDTKKLWCRWSKVLSTWVICDAVDDGAVLFHRAATNREE